MTAVPIETLEYSVRVARIVGKEVYLKGSVLRGWRLFDEAPQVPYFIVTEGNDVQEIEKD